MKSFSGDPANPNKAASDRRVQACVLACEGIPTEKLESGVLIRLVAACVHVADPRVREVLEELSALRPRLVRAGGSPTPGRKIRVGPPLHA